MSQSTWHSVNYFNCSAPAKKWKCLQGQHCSIKQRGSRNNKKVKWETLVLPVGANIQTTIHVINCLEGQPTFFKHTLCKKSLDCGENHQRSVKKITRRVAFKPFHQAQLNWENRLHCQFPERATNNNEKTAICDVLSISYRARKMCQAGGCHQSKHELVETTAKFA